jgi:ABC-type lipoprotein release transport system permease subunit
MVRSSEPYFPVDQPPATFRVSPRDLDVRVSGDPRQAIPAIREAVRRSEPGLVVDRVEAMDARVSGDVRRERVVAYLAASFAALALFLASLGLYGVLSYAVTSRTQEIGIRMSLGARSQEIGRLVMRDAWRMVAVGVLAGLGAALATGRLLDALLVGVTASDPFTYAIVLATLALSTLVAAYLPARRATRVDPLQALRGD